MTLGLLTNDLRQCAGCGFWSRWLNRHHRCGICVRGWTTCLRHGHLEHDDGSHRRVTVREILDAVPDTRGVGP